MTLPSFRNKPEHQKNTVLLASELFPTRTLMGKGKGHKRVGECSGKQRSYQLTKKADAFSTTLTGR